MNGVKFSKPGAARGPVGPAARLCERPDLEAWAERGGPLPSRLAAHVEHCPACADRVRRVSQVHASLTLLGSQPLPANLHARANGRALRMLRRVTRASAAAADLLRTRPNLSPWQRAQIYIARASLSAVAAMIVLIIRVGIISGFERTEALGQALASAHWDRHIDPNHEWLA